MHKELGNSFLEAVYQSAMTVEFGNRSIPYEREKLLPVFYEEKALDVTYKADLICYGKIIVELKAMSRLTSKEEAQRLNDLNATGFWLGVLINVGSHGRLEWKRLVK